MLQFILSYSLIYFSKVNRIMSNKLPLWLIDSFTKEAFAGNPAGVCLVEEFPEKSFMQKIANEMYWSETAFVKKLNDNQFHIRWFSPEDEAPICGHATLAASHFLWQSGILKDDKITFISSAGELYIEKESLNNEDLISMRFPAISVHKNLEHNDIIKKSLGIGSTYEDSSILEILTDGLIFVVVFDSEDKVKNCVPDIELIKTLPGRAIVITAQSNDKNADFVLRYFAPKVGIIEDPVCGSAHCRLVPFWSNKLNKKSLVSHQLSKRGGWLYTEYKESENKVKIAGTACTVMIGEIKV